jgi:hypothetical protein
MVAEEMAKTGMNAVMKKETLCKYLNNAEGQNSETPVTISIEGHNIREIADKSSVETISNL